METSFPTVSDQMTGFTLYGIHSSQAVIVLDRLGRSWYKNQVLKLCFDMGTGLGSYITT